MIAGLLELFGGPFEMGCFVGGLGLIILGIVGGGMDLLGQTFPQLDKQRSIMLSVLGLVLWGIAGVTYLVKKNAANPETKIRAPVAVSIPVPLSLDDTDKVVIDVFKYASAYKNGRKCGVKAQPKPNLGQASVNNNIITYRHNSDKGGTIKFPYWVMDTLNRKAVDTVVVAVRAKSVVVIEKIACLLNVFGTPVVEARSHLMGRDTVTPNSSGYCVLKAGDNDFDYHFFIPSSAETLRESFSSKQDTSFASYNPVVADSISMKFGADYQGGGVRAIVGTAYDYTVPFDSLENAKDDNGNQLEGVKMLHCAIQIYGRFHLASNVNPNNKLCFKILRDGKFYQEIDNIQAGCNVVGSTHGYRTAIQFKVEKGYKYDVQVYSIIDHENRLSYGSQAKVI